MMTGRVAMRAMVVMALATALGGCYSIRHRNDPDQLAAAGQPVPKDAKAAKGKDRKADREVLPTGLAGDREHHAYTDSPQ